jgi:hypothetical protein
LESYALSRERLQILAILSAVAAWDMHMRFAEKVIVVMFVIGMALFGPQFYV